MLLASGARMWNLFVAGNFVPKMLYCTAYTAEFIYAKQLAWFSMQCSATLYSFEDTVIEYV